MAFRGPIANNSPIRVVLTSAFANSGSAVLIGGAAVAGGAKSADSVVVAPGGSDHVDVRTGKTGLFQLVVDFKLPVDKGLLEVFVRDELFDRDEISGDLVTWTYSVA